jgi:hypothetical protein
MKRLLLFVVIAFLAGSPVRAASDAEVAARSAVLELAGAFSNDGYKLRDGHWSGVLKPREGRLIEVNLYAGNQYWFSLATAGPARKVAVRVYNENGERMQTDPYEAEGRAAAGFAPSVSGAYFVEIEETEGEPADFCFIYSYK